MQRFPYRFLVDIRAQLFSCRRTKCYNHVSRLFLDSCWFCRAYHIDHCVLITGWNQRRPLDEVGDAKDVALVEERPEEEDSALISMLILDFSMLLD